MIFWKEGGSFSLAGKPVGDGPRESFLSESLADIVAVYDFRKRDTASIEQVNKNARL